VDIPNWISTDDWIHGETGGYLRYTRETRNWFETEYATMLIEAEKPLSQWKRTDEHASHIIEALETGRPYRGHFNVKNRGVITNLPEDCITESPGWVDRFGINMVEGVTLPLACAATCRGSVDEQRMSVQAAITGDVDLLKLAVLHDPLVGAVCTPSEVWSLVDEMLAAQGPMASAIRKTGLTPIPGRQFPGGAGGFRLTVAWQICPLGQGRRFDRLRANNHREMDDAAEAWICPCRSRGGAHAGHLADGADGRNACRHAGRRRCDR
jgi:hypothetical protein